MIFKNSEDGKTLIAKIYGEIGWCVNAQSFRSQLENNKAENLEVHIDSCGGDVIEALGIFNAIKDFKGNTTAIIDGVAMSAASYIMLACQTIKAQQNAVIMIHQVSCFGGGTAEDLEHIAEVCRKFESIIRKAYAERTGKSEEEIQELLEAETFFTAEEAKEAKLVDEVLTSATNFASLKLVAMARNENFKRFLSRKNQKANEQTIQTKGIINMEIKTLQDLISALETFAEKIEDETLKAELNKIIEAGKALDKSSNEGTGEESKKEEEEDATEAENKRKQAILAFANSHGAEALNSITIKALAGNTSLEDFKSQVCDMLFENSKKVNKSAFLQIKDKAEVKPEDVKKEYEKIVASGDESKRREFFKAHKAELLYK